MSIKRIKKDEDVYKEFKMSKYELFVIVIDEIGGFPEIFIDFYLDNTAYDSSDFFGFKINNGWNDMDETATYISKFYWSENDEDEDDEIRVYYTHEEFFQYFLSYYLENINCYGNMIGIIEQEFVNYAKHTDSAKTHEIKVDVMNVFKTNNLRNFLLKYNMEENKYLYGFINFYNEYINYWDINILKKFMSYLMGKGILKEFFKGKREFKINEANYFGDRGYNEGYTIKINKTNILINYYTKDNMLGKYYNVIDKMGIQYRNYIPSDNYAGNFMLKNEVDKFVREKYKGTRKEMNVEIVKIEDFIKETEIIVNAYEKIYMDTEVQKMFKNFKKKLDIVETKLEKDETPKSEEILLKKSKKPKEQTYDSIRNWLLLLLREDNKIIFPKEEFLEKVKLFDEAEKLRTFNVIKSAVEHNGYCVKFEEGKMIEGYEVKKVFGEMLGIAVEEGVVEKVEEKEVKKKLTPQQWRKKKFLERMKKSKKENF